MKNTKHLSLRIDEDLLRKFRHVCAYEGRSANSQLLMFIRKAIENFEKEHEKIELDENN